MEVEIKNRWVQALRSGEFVQGFGRLRGPGETPGTYTYCALGVLGAIDGDYYSYARFDELIGGGTDCADEVWHFNDVLKWPFEKIADWIEENL